MAERAKGTVILTEGHTLTLVEGPLTAGPRYTVRCTCGDTWTADYAVCVQAVPALHRFDLAGVVPM